MNAFKLGASKALRQTAETVHGPVLPACGENPDDLSISLERVHVVQVQKVVVLRMASHQLGDRPGFAPVQRAQGSLHSKGTLQGPAPGSAGPVQGRSEAALTDRLEQVVHGSDLEGVEGMLGIRGHEHDGRQGTPEPSDHLESVHDRHLDVQEDQIRLQMADLPQRRLPAVRFAHDLDVFHGGQPFQQHSAGQRLIVHDQYTQFFPGHVTRPLKRRSGGRGGRRYLSQDLEDLDRLSTELSDQVERRRRTELNRLVAEAELDALRARINPHFLFNSLNALYATIPRSAVDARKTLVNLAEIVRYSLQGTRRFVSLDQEMRIVQAYLQIERLRLGERLRTGIDIVEDTLQIAVPVLSIQPLVENAVNPHFSPGRYAYDEK